jgi:hypothetical protein
MKSRQGEREKRRRGEEEKRGKIQTSLFILP